MIRFFTGFAGALMRELRRMMDTPILVIFAVFLPLMTLLFMFFLFDDAVPRNLPVAICDQDHSSLSRQVERAVNATPSARVAFHVQDPIEGKKLLLRREIYALVIIPLHFEQDVLKGAAPPVINYYNNIYLTAGALVYRDIASAVGTVSAGVKVKKLVAMGTNSAAVKGLAVPISIVSQRLFNPSTNYQYYLSGGFMPTVFQMFAILTFILALGFEIKEGTAGDWLRSARGNPVAALAGKCTPYLLIFMVIGIFMVTMLIRFADVPVEGNLHAIFLALFLLIIASMCVSIFFVAVFANLRFALSIGAFYAAIAFSFSGLTFPFLGMPSAVRYIGEFIPLTQYIRVFIGQALRGAPLETNLPSFAALVMFWMLPVIVMPRWRRLFTEDRFWGGI